MSGYIWMLLSKTTEDPPESPGQGNFRQYILDESVYDIPKIILPRWHKWLDRPSRGLSIRTDVLLGGCGRTRLVQASRKLRFGGGDPESLVGFEFECCASPAMQTQIDASQTASRMCRLQSGEVPQVEGRLQSSYNINMYQRWW
ncbi:hypothetical protein TWF718_004242 [Orbilia javanica]|uniref:Uncharacterized protein n=1 Tax=Orbilia javanica TaxID=47235 RepID=A0AAN8RKP4_9PEZI